MIFKMNSLTSERESERESEKEEEETVEKRENNTNAKKPRPRKGHQNSVLILSRSLEEEVCIRVRHMPPSPFKQQERLLRIILLALNLSHGEDQVHQGQLQQAVVEEVLRAPRPALLVTLLVPPHSLSTPLTSDTASMDTSSLLYLRLTNPCALRALREAESKGQWQTLSPHVRSVLRLAQLCGGDEGSKERVGTKTGH